LADALASGAVSVEEVPDGWQKQRVRLVNRGEAPVLVLGGEQLLGWEQDRIVTMTTAVPGKGAVDLPVASSEQGRWRTRPGFSTAGFVANPSIRSRAVADACASLAAGGGGTVKRSTLWAGIDEILRRVGVESETRALADAYLGREEAVDGLVRGFALEPGQVGAAFLIGRQLVGVELLGDSAAWERAFPAIVRGFALEALGRGGLPAPPGGRRERVCQALLRLETVAWTLRGRVGAGRPLTLAQSDVVGTALLMDGQVAHLAAFLDPRVPGAPHATVGTKARGQLAILVLDDDPARHAVFAVEGRGHRIDHAWFVDDAVARLRRTRYDLVCLDNDLQTEAGRREGHEVAEFIAGMPEESRPRAVLVHSWNGPRALDMERLLSPLYAPGVTLLRVEFGSFRLVGPGPACAGSADLRRWVARDRLVEPAALGALDGDGAGPVAALEGA